LQGFYPSKDCGPGGIRSQALFERLYDGNKNEDYKMIKIKLKEDLIKRSGKTARQVGIDANITYPVINKITHDKFNPVFFAILGKFLEAVGYTEWDLKIANFTDIFEVGD
jgi:hypothetical protein